MFNTLMGGDNEKGRASSAEDVALLVEHHDGAAQHHTGVLGDGGDDDVPRREETEDFQNDPDDEPVPRETLARYIDPWWVGTLGITLTKAYVTKMSS